MGAPRKKIVKKDKTPKASSYSDPRIPTVADAVKAGIAKLIDRHVEGVMQFVKDSETQKCNWTFTAQIDNSEPEMHLKVTTAFSKRVSDGVTADITDPNQLEFHNVGEVAQNENPPDEETAEQAEDKAE